MCKRQGSRQSNFQAISQKSLDKPDLLVSPIGARGIGEIGINSMAAFVANVITNATGKRIRDLPVTLDKLMK